MAKIWVVEDDDLVAQMISGLLATQGHEVTNYLGGQAALDALENVKQHPDLLVVDLRMSKPSGNDVLRKVKEIGRPLVVIITEDMRSLDEDVREIPKGVIAKPFAFTDLIHTVDTVISKPH